MQLEDDVQREEDEVVHGQGGQVTTGGVAHPLPDPHGEGQDVAGEPHAVDEDGHVLVHADHLGGTGTSRIV